nr:Ig-like domain-containing protein [Lachnospiraceae bacterium]
MKKIRGKKLIIWMTLTALLTALMICVGAPLQAQAAVKINKTKKTMVIGNTYRLKISGTSKKVKWSSSNKKVATVSSKGLVTAKKTGTATITAKVGSKKYKCKITVKTQQEVYRSTLISQINKERRKYGYASFDKNSLLHSAAQKRAKELATKFSHTRPNGYKWTSAISMRYDFKRAAENIARDFVTPDRVIDAWMAKSSTKAKIVSKRYDEIGVGVYLSPDGYFYWCAIFAKEK